MSASGGRQKELTLEDLDRFVSQSLEEEPLTAGENDQQAPLHDWTAYLDAAAVLVVFDPFQLRPARRRTETSPRGSVLDHLYQVSEPILSGPFAGFLTLTHSERRSALRRLGSRSAMRRALSANRNRPDSPIQRMFERVVENAPIALDSLSRDDLAGMITVVDWLDGVLDGLPEKGELQAALARADRLAPMKRLVATGFVDRHEELGRLVEYLRADTPRPLFVFGPGGVGKSTLLARFVLTEVVGNEHLFVYIDLDRPTMRPDQPLTILLEIVMQLGPQLLLPDDFLAPFVKEIGFAISRDEYGREFESVNVRSPIWGFVEQLQRLFDYSPLPNAGTKIVLLIDTFEEAQYLGEDTVDQLLEFAHVLAYRFPAFRVLLSGRALPEQLVAIARDRYQGPSHDAPGIDLSLSELLALVPLPERPIDLAVLDDASARELLQASIHGLGLDPLTNDECDDVVSIVSRSPMCIKLAARLLQAEGLEKLRASRSQFLLKLKAEKIQALLYGRILEHIHGPEDVRSVAYPGLVVRRIAPDIIREVLAKPCNLTLTPARNETHIFEDLKKEAWLVQESRDGSIRHRVDVRRAMLEDLAEHVDPALVAQIDQLTVEYYEAQTGPALRAEEIYHRLRLKQPHSMLDSRWIPECGMYLRDAGEELPPRQRLWLAEKLLSENPDVDFTEEMRKAASQETWEERVALSARRMLLSRAPDKALQMLQERQERLPRSQLYLLEAEANQLAGQPDAALEVARCGVEALSRAGAIDMALQLQLRMVTIEESRGQLQEAEKLLKFAEEIAPLCRDDMLRLRVQINGLRLQRQLRPAARQERAQRRRVALDCLDERMLRRVQAQPVLLREVAAELAKEDARVAQAAIETLGLEVTNDNQVQALGKALVTLGNSSAEGAGSVGILSEAAHEIEETNFDPNVIRGWVTSKLTGGDIREVAATVGQRPAKSAALSDFREYFREGVSQSLQGR